MMKAFFCTTSAVLFVLIISGLCVLFAVPEGAALDRDIPTRSPSAYYFDGNAPVINPDPSSAGVTFLPPVADSDKIIVIENDISYYSIRYPSRGSAVEKAAAERLAAAVEAVTGKKMTVRLDGIDAAADKLSKTREILIGSADRPESEVAKEALGDSLSFCIRITDTKIIIVGANETLTELGTEYFITNYLERSGTASAGNWSLKKGDYVSEPLPSVISNILSDGVDFDAFAEKVADIPLDGNYAMLQGGCSDGEYFYCVIENTIENRAQSLSKIYKIRISDMQIEAVGGPLQIDRGSDLTYNARYSRLTAVHREPNDTRLSFIDPETLTVIGTQTLGFSVSALAYCKSTDSYCAVVGGTDQCLILGNDFSQTGQFTLPAEADGTVSGIDCDDRYLYIIQNDPNKITVCRFDGTAVAAMPLSESEVHPLNNAKSIALCTDFFLVGVDHLVYGGELCRVTLKMRTVEN